MPYSLGASQKESENLETQPEIVNLAQEATVSGREGSTPPLPFKLKLKALRSIRSTREASTVRFRATPC